MKAPIAEFIENYKRSGSVRLHMPGHKGMGKHCEDDITEIPGADELFNADGIINESEEYASELFGTGRTLYSTEGSSLSIRAMLHLATIFNLAGMSESEIDEANAKLNEIMNSEL